MAFHHLAGVTTLGAADEIIDWFNTFQAWIVGTVGWTIFSGAGTTNLRISSQGEAGGLTMLFLHIWRGAGANIDRVYLEVSDDGIPTHETTRGGYVDSGGVQFASWMSADKDALVLVWKLGAGYRMVYGGLVYPFALTVPDETYQMIATQDIFFATILRRHDGVWDMDDTLYNNIDVQNARRDRDDGSLTIGGTYFADNADIAGQLKHVSCRITDPPTAPEDTLDSQEPGGTTEWIILSDSNPLKFALRTGGVLPTGKADGTFAHSTAVANTITDWFTALTAFLTGRGWAVTDISLASGRMWDIEANSSGEDATEDIWIRVSCPGIGGIISCYAADSAYGTPGRHETAPGRQPGVGQADFPTTYYLSGDKDCILHTTRTPAGFYAPMFQGLISVVAPGLSSTYMKVACFGGTPQPYVGNLVLGHEGTWIYGLTCQQFGDGAHCSNCNPNLYDGTTYLVWPMFSTAASAGAREPIGNLKYYFATNGGGIASLDTITVAGVTYTVFFWGAAATQAWAMRTV